VYYACYCQSCVVALCILVWPVMLLVKDVRGVLRTLVSRPAFLVVSGGNQDERFAFSCVWCVPPVPVCILLLVISSS